MSAPFSRPLSVNTARGGAWGIGDFLNQAKSSLGKLFSKAGSVVRANLPAAKDVIVDHLRNNGADYVNAVKTQGLQGALKEAWRNMPGLISKVAEKGKFMGVGPMLSPTVNSMQPMVNKEVEQNVEIQRDFLNSAPAFEAYTAHIPELMNLIHKLGSDKMTDEEKLFRVQQYFLLRETLRAKAYFDHFKYADPANVDALIGFFEHFVGEILTILEHNDRSLLVEKGVHADGILGTIGSILAPIASSLLGPIGSHIIGGLTHLLGSGNGPMFGRKNDGNWDFPQPKHKGVLDAGNLLNMTQWGPYDASRMGQHSNRSLVSSGPFLSNGPFLSQGPFAAGPFMSSGYKVNSSGPFLSGSVPFLANGPHKLQKHMRVSVETLLRHLHGHTKRSRVGYHHLINYFLPGLGELLASHPDYITIALKTQPVRWNHRYKRNKTVHVPALLEEVPKKRHKKK